VVEDKYNLLKPILSRFCEIYVPEPIIDGEMVNLYKYNMKQTFNMNDVKKQRIESLKKELIKLKTKKLSVDQMMTFCEKMYEKGYSGLDILNLLQTSNFLELEMSIEKKYEFLVCFNKVKKEFRNERIIMLFILNFLFLSSELSLENISFM
jgi:hypothetical protein